MQFFLNLNQATSIYSQSPVENFLFLSEQYLK